MEYEELIARLLAAGEESIDLCRSGLATQARICSDLLHDGGSVVWVVKNRDELSAALALLRVFGGEDVPADFREKIRVSLPPLQPSVLSPAVWAERIVALYSLRHARARCLVLAADNLLPRYFPTDFFAGCELLIRAGEELSPDMILEQAVSWGYARVSMVSNPGDIARRGDILDIMPPGYEKPLRLDFFGDSLEEIRLFDPASQRSLENVREVLVLPVSPVALDEGSRKARTAYWKKLRQACILTDNEQFGLGKLAERGDFRLLPGACAEEASLLEDWLPKNSVWLLPGRQELEESLLAAEEQWRRALEEQDAEGNPQPYGLNFRAAEDVRRAWEHAAVTHAEPLVMGVEKHGPDLPERTYRTFAELFPAAEDQERPWQTLMQSLRSGGRRQKILCFSTERSRKKFLKLAEGEDLYFARQYNPGAAGLFAVLASFAAGVDMSWADILILGEKVLQPRQDKGRRVASHAFRGLEDHRGLEPGDLLVHRDYGIARFAGLVRMDAGSTANDYLLLYYADDDKLYVPVDRLSLVQRFQGGGEEEPALDKLGGNSWQAGKEKARKAIEKVAQDIVEMYAWRKVGKGFSYAPVGELYREFEASFGFEETPDQARAIQDVLEDMEKPRPMDRLVCGDVGFGKTEVALRAAFRAAASGRQVALLCPTTVLAEQHYQTFRARLSNFAINVGLLSRFVPAGQQKDVLKAAAAGKIDVLIGTHRLLSDDVLLPNLGLLILDEEQRFGVRHKEKLKKIKKNVDVLTLTATPIPRTLQLSMSGVRELSVIETAPPERKPVSTAILERDRDALRSVVERELARGGQVFWVYNRVQGLERTVEFVKELAPQARIGMAHGQLPERKLEETMHAFWHGELDILVCTAIVESGLDFPRANTLIVDQAQMFGLGQLYQLRGRVGRSDRQAFACFVVSDLKHLPEKVRERLRIILDLDYLGAGFQVAMEDLRMRGAGNILGEVQSGHMGRIGLDLYLEMLEQAVARIRGEGVDLQTETELTIALTANIPEQYIADGRERLLWYKRLSSARDDAARRELELELRDRYGALPEELKTFVAVLRFKQFLTENRALRADIHQDRVRIAWDEHHAGIDPERLLAYMAKNGSGIRILPPATLELKLDTEIPVPDRLEAVHAALAGLMKRAT